MQLKTVGTLVASFLLAAPVAAAVGLGSQPTVRSGCTAGTYSMQAYRDYASRVYKRQSVSKQAARRLARMSRCQLSGWGLRWVKRYHARFMRERASRRYALYRCAFGRFAIPCYVVWCESKGRNLQPNGATASGFYQFIRATWRSLGGSTTHAYQASKLEQDRLAAKLWNGGSGASQWDCA